MSDDDDATLEILQAVQNGLPAETAVKLLQGASAPAEAPEPPPEPEPVATGPVPVAPSPYGRPNPGGEAAYALAALRRDIPRLAPAPPDVDDGRGEAA